MEQRYMQDRLPKDHGARICYGCGSDNEHGLRIKSYIEGDKALCKFLPKAHHTAFPGVVNGGIIATIMDCHGIWTAIAMKTKALAQLDNTEKTVMFVTRKMTLEYLKPTPMGRELTLTGEVIEEKERASVVKVSLDDGDKVTVTAEIVAVKVEG